MKTLLTCLAVVLVSTGVMAQTRPFNASITPSFALHDSTETIHGLTLSIWGENPQKSFAFGIVNGSTGESAGLSLGILNYAENYKGLQWGVVNYNDKDTLGWQGGFCVGVFGSLVNYTGGTMKGFQSGVVNYAGRLTGLQIGLLNFAEAAEAGCQIGLVNIIRDNKAWFTELPDALAPGMVLANWRF